MSEKQRGIIKQFHEDRGFGFIESQGRDYFVHISAIKGQGPKPICKGAPVLFIADAGGKGLRAEAVELV